MCFQGSQNITIQLAERHQAWSRTGGAAVTFTGWNDQKRRCSAPIWYSCPGGTAGFDWSGRGSGQGQTQADPARQLIHLGLGQFSVGRHLQVALVADRLDKETLLWFARDGGRPRVAAFQHRCAKLSAGRTWAFARHDIFGSALRAGAGFPSRRSRWPRECPYRLQLLRRVAQLRPGSRASIGRRVGAWVNLWLESQCLKSSGSGPGCFRARPDPTLSARGRG